MQFVYFSVGSQTRPKRIRRKVLDLAMVESKERWRRNIGGPTPEYLNVSLSI
jgi:hypothetical protein